MHCIKLCLRVSRCVLLCHQFLTPKPFFSLVSLEGLWLRCSCVCCVWTVAAVYRRCCCRSRSPPRSPALPALCSAPAAATMQQEPAWPRVCGCAHVIAVLRCVVLCCLFDPALCLSSLSPLQPSASALCPVRHVVWSQQACVLVRIRCRRYGQVWRRWCGCQRHVPAIRAELLQALHRHLVHQARDAPRRRILRAALDHHTSAQAQSVHKRRHMHGPAATETVRQAQTVLRRNPSRSIVVAVEPFSSDCSDSSVLPPSSLATIVEQMQTHPPASP